MTRTPDDVRQNAGDGADVKRTTTPGPPPRIARSEAPVSRPAAAVSRQHKIVAPHTNWPTLVADGVFADHRAGVCGRPDPVASLFNCAQTAQVSRVRMRSPV